MRFFLTSLTIITVWLGSTLALPIQSLSGSSHVALERRTNEPPKPKLTEEEFTVKTQEAAKGMQAAFRRFPDMEARLLDILGLNNFNGQTLTRSEVNDALREVGYQGPLFPELSELEESSVYRGELSRGYQEQEDDAWPRIVLALDDPVLLRRVRSALGLEPDGPIPEKAYTDQEWNKALREAGYGGMLLPEADPPRPRILMAGTKARGPDPEGSGSEGSGSGGRGSGGGSGSSGRGFGGRQNHGRPNKFSLDDDDRRPPWSQFLSTTSQSFRQRLGVITSKLHSAGSRAQSAPLFPTISQPLGVFRPIK